ncbi:DNA-formamidopyrimidine glycosylase family protein [Pelagicoccus sp. SDUM812002]|uniref:DNA-formamidopyrimidine glycosylase family protein n=1 Tax=Pelagicoccus sp. SDUM812002 TaxID=3041266 RepID=UPI00280E5C66|nr:DNA-formamidopyrimidine glycosylase family protein [Pelagicoccus sp. SDUM812002]MDQ8187837.1 DNA-formamidopyrimidine glycosylase family protein [Pelagicoccus sp. SDUM812002]
MPELAEVFFHSSHWKAACGERFDVAWFHSQPRCCRELDAATLVASIDSAQLLSGYTHGKRMLFAFSGNRFLEVHLGMTGSLHRLQPDHEELKHDHLALRSSRSLLVFRDPRQFGRLALHETDDGELPGWWKDLPPQPHDRAFTRKRFHLLLQRRDKAIVKSLLLQQELFPGVGNWMADEILWRARLKPDRRLGTLKDAERNALFKELRWVCREALRIIGKDYSDPPKQWLFTHRWRDGGICPVSGVPLRRDTIGGRTTCWSPEVQL